MLIQNCLLVHLLIVLNEMTKIPKLVPHWLVPGFDAKYEGCEILGFERRDYEIVGDLREEVARMHAHLGVIADTGQPVFDAAYGPGNAGLLKVRDLIQSRPDESDIKLARDVDLDLGESITLDAHAGGDAQVDNELADALEAANAAANEAQAENDALRAKLAALEAADAARKEHEAQAAALPSPAADGAKEPSGDGAGKAADPLADAANAKQAKSKG